MATSENILIEETSKDNPYNDSVKFLSKGMVKFYEPPLVEVKKELKELVDKQNDLLQKIHSENSDISEVQHSPELQAMFDKLKLYHSKLLAIKKDIRVLHDRTKKLKKRAVRLQEFKPKEIVIEGERSRIQGEQKL